VARYALFAAIATATNIAVQMVFQGLYDGSHRLVGAMAAGTLAGLVVKYLLDRRWIFHDRRQGLAAHGGVFFLYTLTGVATTAVFWATELAFDALSQDARMKYVGAVLGLAIGYFAKYHLDRRITFWRAA